MLVTSQSLALRTRMPDEEGIQVTVGPLIGLVTDTSARVLFEINFDADFVSLTVSSVTKDFASDMCRQISGDNYALARQVSSTGSSGDVDAAEAEAHEVTGETRKVKANVPFVIELKNLRPGTWYRAFDVSVSGVPVFRVDGIPALLPVPMQIRTLGARQEERIPMIEQGEGLFDANPHDANDIWFVGTACDRSKHTFDPDMWEHLWKQVITRFSTNTPIVYLRIGDQVYCDRAFEKCEELLFAKDDSGSYVYDMNNRERRLELLELYREQCRITLNRKYVRLCLSHCSGSLCLWDDHDSGLNDFGTIGWHQYKDDPATLERWLLFASIWRRTYWEYQRQLWDPTVSEMLHDSGDAASLLDEYSVHPAFGVLFEKNEGFAIELSKSSGIGVLMVDGRTHRAYDVSQENGFLGALQWKSIQYSLFGDASESAPSKGPIGFGDGDAAAAAGDAHERGEMMARWSADRFYDDLSSDRFKTLVVCHTMPTLFLSEGCSGCLAGCISKLQDKTGFGRSDYQRERSRYLRLLRHWQLAQRGPNRRKIIMLGGDLHFAYRSRMTWVPSDPSDGEDPLVLHQYITTPINNTQPNLFYTVVFGLVLNCFLCTPFTVQGNSADEEAAAPREELAPNEIVEVTGIKGSGAYRINHWDLVWDRNFLLMQFNQESGDVHDVTLFTATHGLQAWGTHESIWD